MTKTTILTISATGFAFGWLMMATECRPFLPLVKLMLAYGGAV